MAVKKVLPRYAYLEEQSTEQLESYLREDFAMPGCRKDDEIDAILSILAARREKDPSRKTIDPNAAWDAFCKDHAELLDATDTVPQIETAGLPRRRKLRWGRIVAAAVIVLLTFFAMTIPAVFGAENIFTVIGRWTDSIFSFQHVGTPSEPVSEGQLFSENAGLQRLYTAASPYIGDAKVIPTWLPEGFEFKEVQISSTPRYEKIYAVYSKEGTELFIEIDVFSSDISKQYEKDVLAADEIEIDGIRYYFMTNNDIWSCSWVNNIFECHIWGTVEKDELYKIIYSIGENNA